MVGAGDRMWRPLINQKRQPNEPWAMKELPMLPSFERLRLRYAPVDILDVPQSGTLEIHRGNSSPAKGFRA